MNPALIKKELENMNLTSDRKELENMNPSWKKS